jgi:hypothetical protein
MFDPKTFIQILSFYACNNFISYAELVSIAWIYRQEFRVVEARFENLVIKCLSYFYYSFLLLKDILT